MPLSLAQHPESDALLDRDPLALLIGMLLDQQIPMEHAFWAPAELARRLGADHLDAHVLAGHDPEELVAVFATPRALALSYVDAYVDYTGRVTGYAVVDLGKAMGRYKWRTAGTNVWKVERVLLDYPHHRIRTSDVRFKMLKTKYKAFREANDGRKPLYYRGRERWTEIPDEFGR